MTLDNKNLISWANARVVPPEIWKLEPWFITSCLRFTFYMTWIFIWTENNKGKLFIMSLTFIMKLPHRSSWNRKNLKKREIKTWMPKMYLQMCLNSVVQCVEIVSPWINTAWLIWVIWTYSLENESLWRL